MLSVFFWRRKFLKFYKKDLCTRRISTHNSGLGICLWNGSHWSFPQFYFHWAMKSVTKGQSTSLNSTELMWYCYFPMTEPLDISLPQLSRLTWLMTVLASLLRWQERMDEPLSGLAACGRPPTRGPDAACGCRGFPHSSSWAQWSSGLTEHPSHMCCGQACGISSQQGISCH